MPHVPLDPGYYITAKQCKSFADYCKVQLYSKSGAFLHAFPHDEARKAAEEMTEYLNKEERFRNKHIHMNPHKTLHEMMRTWMHIHFPIQTSIVEHYLMKKNQAGVYSRARTPQTKAEISQKFLRDCIREEREQNSSISNSWDVKLSDLLVSRHADSYYAALDHWLTALRDDIVLIQWCADWFDELQFYEDEHGPLHALLEPRAGKLPTYRLMHSNQVVRLKNEEYFNVSMAEQLKRLQNEDLANIIKLQWYDSTPALARMGRRNAYHGITYDGIDVPVDFVSRKAMWMKQLEFHFNYHSQKWQKENTDCAYDLMKPENFLAYHIDPSISLRTMFSGLLLDTVNIATESGGLLLHAFTTAANGRKGKAKNQSQQKTKKQKSQAANNGLGPNHAELPSPRKPKEYDSEEERNYEDADDRRNEYDASDKPKGENSGDPDDGASHGAALRGFGGRRAVRRDNRDHGGGGDHDGDGGYGGGGGGGGGRFTRHGGGGNEWFQDRDGQQGRHSQHDVEAAMEYLRNER